MKKNLVLLTGIVFVLSILLAGACNRGIKKEDPLKEEATEKKVVILDDRTKPIYLKDSIIDKKMHLFMSDDNKSECGVIDDHLIIVKRMNTVTWKNAIESEIDEIIFIRPVGDSTFFGAVPEFVSTGVDSTEVFRISNGVHKLVIPDSATLDTLIKYEIGFTVDDGLDTIYTIDPYLKIPNEL